MHLFLQLSSLPAGHLRGLRKLFVKKTGFYVNEKLSITFGETIVGHAVSYEQVH